MIEARPYPPCRVARIKIKSYITDHQYIAFIVILYVKIE